MLTELCQELKNWFVKEQHIGTFEITGGILTADFLKDNQYYRIVGSIFNDGVYQYGVDLLEDETFDGSIWALAIPKEVIQLADDITEWQKKYGAVDSYGMSPFSSESFGGYMYTKAGTNNSNNSGRIGASWKTAFAPRLNAWRKL